MFLKYLLSILFSFFFSQLKIKTIKFFLSLFSFPLQIVLVKLFQNFLSFIIMYLRLKPLTVLSQD